MSISTRAGLQQLKQQLERRSQLIRQAASLTKISFGEVNDHYFTVHVWWKGGELLKRFTHEEHFDAFKLNARPCEVTRRFIREILTQRGI